VPPKGLDRLLPLPLPSRTPPPKALPPNTALPQPPRPAERTTRRPAIAHFPLANMFVHVVHNNPPTNPPDEPANEPADEPADEPKFPT